MNIKFSGKKSGIEFLTLVLRIALSLLMLPLTLYFQVYPARAMEVSSPVIVRQMSATAGTGLLNDVSVPEPASPVRERAIVLKFAAQV